MNSKDFNIMNGRDLIPSSIRSYSPITMGSSYNHRKKKTNDESMSSSLSSIRSLTSVLHRARSNSPSTLEKKLIILTKDNTNGLGFTLRGGVEHGLGHFVSAVEQDSVAYKQGLKPGDQIVCIGGLSLVGATHKEVVSLISSVRPQASVRFYSIYLINPFWGILGHTVLM